MATPANSFFIGSSSFLQATSTYMEMLNEFEFLIDPTVDFGVICP